MNAEAGKADVIVDEGTGGWVMERVKYAVAGKVKVGIFWEACLQGWDPK